MSHYPDGAYNFYPINIERPMLIELEGDWAYSMHFDYPVHVRMLGGRLVRLIEVQCLDEMASDAAKENPPVRAGG